jgi:antitoxin Phd
MHVWPVQDAKARFSEFLDAAPSLKALLLSNTERSDLVLPQRGQAKRRTPVVL